MTLLNITPAVGSKVIRVFPRRTHWTPDDELAFTGEPPMFRPGNEWTPVMVSVTFTWDRHRAEQLAKSWGMFYRDVRIGGPAYDDPAGEFTPGMFLKKGCTITSRGFSQLYQPPTADRPTKIYPQEWKLLNRKWSRPAAYMSDSSKLPAVWQKSKHVTKHSETQSETG